VALTPDPSTIATSVNWPVCADRLVARQQDNKTSPRNQKIRIEIAATTSTLEMVVCINSTVLVARSRQFNRTRTVVGSVVCDNS
jgi:hypothetical protein